MEIFFEQNPKLALLLFFWTIPWKGVALWKSARRQEKIWFIVILLINTVSILEIFYIFLFTNDRIMGKAKEKIKNLTGKLRKKGASPGPKPDNDKALPPN